MNPVLQAELELLDQILANDDKNGRDFVHAPKEKFWIEGSHGKHHCLVYDLYGMDLDNVAWPVSMVKRLARDSLQALEYIHSKNLCNGSTSSRPFAEQSL